MIVKVASGTMVKQQTESITKTKSVERYEGHEDTLEFTGINEVKVEVLRVDAPELKKQQGFRLNEVVSRLAGNTIYQVSQPRIAESSCRSEGIGVRKKQHQGNTKKSTVCGIELATWLSSVLPEDFEYTTIELFSDVKRAAVLVTNTQGDQR